MKPKPRQAIVTAIGVLGGAVLGTSFDLLIKKSNVLLIVVVVITTLSLIAFSSLVAGLAQAQEEQKGQLVDALDELHRATATAAESLRHDFGLVRESLGQTVLYQVIDQLNREITSTTEDPVTAAVLAAKSEILVLDIVDTAGERPSHAMTDNLVREFLDVLMEHVINTPGLEYRRICQSTNPAAVLPAASTAYYQHLLEMCRHRTSHRSRFSLQAAAVRYPLKFMLIDRRVLMVQLSRYDRSGRHTLEAWSELLFSDAERSLIAAFYDMWRDVEVDPQTRNLAESDIAAPSAPPPP